MAPLPNESSNPSSSSDSKESSSLPGMKRGIGIGVVASLTIIIIAVVTYLALRRRRKLKEKANQASQNQQKLDTEQQQPPLHIISDYAPGADPQEKKFPVYWSSVPAVEADAREIHELDGAGPVPELPTGLHAQELEAVSVERSPHQPSSGEEDTMATRQSQGTLLKDWAKWNAALESSSAENTSSTPPMPPPPAASSLAKENAAPRRSLTTSLKNLKREKNSTTETSTWARPRLALLSTQRTSAAKDRMGSVGSLSPLVTGGGATCSSAGSTTEIDTNLSNAAAMGYTRNLISALSIKKATKKANKKPLPHLADELWLEILSYASPGTLYNTRQVSRDLRRLTAHTIRFHILPSVTILSPDMPLLQDSSSWGVFLGMSKPPLPEVDTNRTKPNNNNNTAYFTLQQSPHSQTTTREVIFPRRAWPPAHWPSTLPVPSADGTEMGLLTDVLICYTMPFSPASANSSGDNKPPPTIEQQLLRIRNQLWSSTNPFYHAAICLIARTRFFNNNTPITSTSVPPHEENKDVNETVVVPGRAVQFSRGGPDAFSRRENWEKLIVRDDTFWEVAMWEVYVLRLLGVMWGREEERGGKYWRLLRRRWKKCVLGVGAVVVVAALGERLGRGGVGELGLLMVWWWMEDA
ncbi:hypothetical protein DM02DRAFT_675400 [Periconia macrospinosa]|uniref:F-box domain-containing protein n=1 Tax=Periconia macrospinosa TaxID=97972 RepID=A0A2V1DCA0_9PLEO|nr:hypothetical protein DM02DRAFT_675400 [Periconia macrospinosa]